MKYLSWLHALSLFCDILDKQNIPQQNTHTEKQKKTAKQYIVASKWKIEVAQEQSKCERECQRSVVVVLLQRASC